MKLIDTFYLGWTSLRSHPSRSLLTIGAIGTLFYLIFTAQLCFQGLENAYLSSTEQETRGTVIISANPYLNDASYDEHSGSLLSPEGISQDIIAHGGTIIDASVTDFGVVLPQNLISSDSPLPTKATPILLTPFNTLQLTQQNCPQYSNSVTSKIKLYQGVHQAIVGQTFVHDGITYSAIGFTTGGFCTSDLSFQNLDRKNTSIFNSILKLFPTPESYSNIILNNGNHLPKPNETSMSTIIATFPDTKTAYHYLLNGHGEFAMLNLPGRETTYSVSTLAGVSPEAIFLFQMAHSILNLLCAILALVATIITIFTSIRLVDQDKHTIQLYRAFGASRRQIRFIYLAYFLELMFGATLLTFTLASLTTILYSACNQTNLSTLFLVGFSLSETPTIILWGLNSTIIVFAIFLVSLAPLAILVNHKRF